MIKQQQTPVATYRIQLNKDFTFQQLTGIVDYLRDLGISHVYLSPVLESAPGSNHGYDTIDFAKVSVERGGDAGLRALDAKIAELGLRIIIDIVPNHMGAHTDNPYWRDVLAKGRQSEHWSLFDMRVPDGGKTQLPVLAAMLEETVSKGDLKLAKDDQEKFVIALGEKSFPLSDETQAQLKEQNIVIPALRGDPEPQMLSPVPWTPAQGGGDNSFDLKEIIAAQNYEFVHWETVKDHVSYRRFFDVNELIGARVEDQTIFDRTHGFLNTLFGELKTLDGVRVDHVDGLVDPVGYLQRLSTFYDAIWVEKILGRGEAMPPAWPVKGATGYEFTAFLNDLMVDKDGFETIEEKWGAMTLAPWPAFHEAVKEGKTFALEILFASELKRLATLTAIDGDMDGATMFWKGVTLFLPVYRTYFDDAGFSESDRAYIDRAVTLARAYYGEAFDQAASRYLPILLEPKTDAQRQAVREWQQLSGPAMAKGLEDTAHYNYTPLTALNEVGCEASLVKANAADELAWLQTRARDWPQAMNATSTHDTKRAEDVRARLYALSAMPKDWLAFAHQAIDMNRSLHSPGAAEEYFLYQAILGTWPFDGTVTDGYRDRIVQYMTKEMKESKRRTSWLHPDQAYETSLLDFTRAVLAHQPFIDLMDDLAARVGPAGALNALAVQTLKCLLPGQPDIYQGTEDWDFSLVDPDNRRPVDYAARRAKLNAALALEQSGGRDALLSDLTANWRDGGIKIWLTRLLLSIRRDDLLPMGKLSVASLVLHNAGGHLTGFELTGQNGGTMLIVVPRNPVAGRESERLTLPDLLLDNVTLDPDGPDMYRDLIAGREVTIEQVRRPGPLLRRFPVMVLKGQ